MRICQSDGKESLVSKQKKNEIRPQSLRTVRRLFSENFNAYLPSLSCQDTSLRHAQQSIVIFVGFSLRVSQSFSEIREAKDKHQLMVDRSCQKLIGAMHRQRRNIEHRSFGSSLPSPANKIGLMYSIRRTELCISYPKGVTRFI